MAWEVLATVSHTAKPQAFIQTAGTDYDLYVTMPYNNGLWLSAFIMTSAPASGDLLTVEVYLS